AVTVLPVRSRSCWKASASGLRSTTALSQNESCFAHGSRKRRAHLSNPLERPRNAEIALAGEHALHFISLERRRAKRWTRIVSPASTGLDEHGERPDLLNGRGPAGHGVVVGLDPL